MTTRKSLTFSSSLSILSSVASIASKNSSSFKILCGPSYKKNGVGIWCTVCPTEWNKINPWFITESWDHKKIWKLLEVAKKELERTEYCQHLIVWTAEDDWLAPVRKQAPVGIFYFFSLFHFLFYNNKNGSCSRGKQNTEIMIKYWSTSCLHWKLTIQSI